MSQEVSSKYSDQTLNKTPHPDTKRATESLSTYSWNVHFESKGSVEDSSEESYDTTSTKEASARSSSRCSSILERNVSQELDKRQRERLQGKEPAPDNFPSRETLRHRHQLLLEVDAWFQRGVAAQKSPPSCSGSFDHLGQPILKIEQLPKILADGTKNDLMESLEELAATYEHSSIYLDVNSKKMATLGLELLRILRKMVDEDNKQRDKRNAAANRLKSAIPSFLDLTKIGIEVFESEELRDDIAKWQTSVQAIEGLFNCGEALCPSAFKKKFAKVLRNGQQLFLNIEKLHNLMRDKEKNDSITEYNLYNKLDTYNRQLSETTINIANVDRKILSMKEELPIARSKLVKMELVTEKLKKKVIDAKNELTAAFESEAVKVDKLWTEVEEVKKTNSILEQEEKRLQTVVTNLEATASNLEERKLLLEELQSLGMPETEIAELQDAPIQHLKDLVEKWKSKNINLPAEQSEPAKQKDISPKKTKSAPQVIPSALEEALKKIKTQEKAFLEEMHNVLPSPLVTPKPVSLCQSEASSESKDDDSDTGTVDRQRRRKSRKSIVEELHKQEPSPRKTSRQQVPLARGKSGSKEELKFAAVGTKNGEAVKMICPCPSQTTGGRQSSVTEDGGLKNTSKRSSLRRERSVTFDKGIFKSTGSDDKIGGEHISAAFDKSMLKGISSTSKGGDRRRDSLQQESALEAAGSEEKISGHKVTASGSKGLEKESFRDESSRQSTNQNASPEPTSELEADTHISLARQAVAPTKQTSVGRSSHGSLRHSLGRNDQTFEADEGLDIIPVGSGLKQSHSPGLRTSSSKLEGRTIQVNQQQVKMMKPMVARPVIDNRHMTKRSSTPHGQSSSAASCMDLVSRDVDTNRSNPSPNTARGSQTSSSQGSRQAVCPGQHGPLDGSGSTFNGQGRPGPKADANANADVSWSDLPDHSGSDLADVSGSAGSILGMEGLEFLEEEAAGDTDHQQEELFTEQAVSFKAGVLQGVQDFKEMRNRMIAQLIKNDLKIHAEILKADLYGFAAGEFATDNELIDNLRTTAQPTMSDFQDIISNAIRELKDRQKIECEKAASTLMKSGVAGAKWKSLSDAHLDKTKGVETAAAIPAGLEAWSQSHEAFKQKEKEYACFLSRYRALWMMYNKERAELLKPLPVDYVPATSIDELLHRVSEDIADEDIPDEPPLEMTAARSLKKEDDQLPKGTSIPSEWKDNLSAAKSAFDEGALCYDDYMEQVQICLKMAAILQQRAMLLGDTFPEMRLKQALNQRVEDILKEVRLKKQTLRSMVRDLGSKYNETMTGLDNMEKAICIEQEQARLMMLMKKSHVNIRRNMIHGMKSAQMKSLTEEVEVEEAEEQAYKEENEMDEQEASRQMEDAQDEKIVEEEVEEEEAVAETDPDREDRQIARIQDEGMSSPPSLSSHQDGITSLAQSTSLTPSLSEEEPRTSLPLSCGHRKRTASLPSSSVPSITISAEDILRQVTATQEEKPVPEEDEESIEFKHRLSLTPSNLIAIAAMGIEDSSGPFLDMTDRPRTLSAINLRPSLVMSHSLDETSSDHDIKALELPSPDIIPPHRSLLYPRAIKTAQPHIVDNSMGLLLVPETKLRRPGKVSFNLPKDESSVSIATTTSKDVVPPPFPVTNALGYLSPQGQISKKVPGPSMPQQLPLLVKHPRLSLTEDSIVTLRSGVARIGVTKKPHKRVHPENIFPICTPTVASPSGITTTSPIESLVSPDQEWCLTRLDHLQPSLASSFAAASPHMQGPLPTPIFSYPSLYDRSPIHPKFLSKQPAATVIVRPISPELGIEVVMPCAEQREGSVTWDDNASTAASSLASSPSFSQPAVSPSLTNTTSLSQTPQLSSLESGSSQKEETRMCEEETESQASGTPFTKEPKPSSLPPLLTSLPTPAPQSLPLHDVGESYELPPVSLKKGPVVFLDMVECHTLPGESPQAEGLSSLHSSSCSPLLPSTPLLSLAERLPNLRSSPCSPLLPLTPLLPTPRMFRPFDGADLQEYLQTLPPRGQNAAAVERSERPRTFIKLQNLREMSGLSTQPCLSSKPHLPSAEVKKVVSWVKGSENLQVPTPSTGITGALMQLKQHRKALRIIDKGGKQLGYRCSRTSRRGSEVVCCPILKEEEAETDEYRLPTSQQSLSEPMLAVCTKQPQAAGWPIKDPNIVPMLESRLLCLDVDQSRRKASNALQLVSSLKTYRLPYDPTCKQVWNKFLTAHR